MLQLYPHNQETYNKVIERLKESNKTCIISPTGTGKSFIFLKWIEDNPGDRFIYVSPSTEIFNQLGEYAAELEQEGLLDNTITISYQKLIHMSDEELMSMHADKIIIDEFHRAGAEQWGEALQILLDANPNAKVLGGTATPIRYLDEGKNMAARLFNNNIARYVTLREAIDSGILPMCKYIPVWYDYDARLEEYQRNIYKNPEDKVPELEAKLEELKRNLQNTYGIHKMFQEHMPTDHGKYIVFCSSYDHVEEMVNIVPEWMNDINRNVRVYVSTMHNTDRDAQFDAFKNDNSDDAIKLLFAIDRLNEGVHIKGIDGVIMLRPTVSPIIYLQQMGRALASGAKESVIFDMVNNYSNLRVAESMNVFLTEFGDCTGDGKNPDSKSESNELFRVFERCYAFHDLMYDLEKILFTSNAEQWEHTFNIFQEYVQMEGKLPTCITKYKNYNIGAWLNHQKMEYKSGKLSEERELKLRSLGVNFNVRLLDILDAQWNESFHMLMDYIQEYKCLPAQKTVYRNYQIGQWLYRQKRMNQKGKLSQIRKNKLKEIGVNLMVSQKELFDGQWAETLAVCQEYIQQMGCTPKDKVVYKGYSLGKWVQNQRTLHRNGKLSADRVEALRKAGVDIDFSRQNKFAEQWNQTFLLLEEFVNETGSFPKDKTQYKGCNVGHWLCNQKTAHKKGKLSFEQESKLRTLGVI